MLDYDELHSRFCFHFQVAPLQAGTLDQRGPNNQCEQKCVNTVGGHKCECNAGFKLVGGRGLHSSTFQLNLSRFGHTSPCPPV